MTGLQIGMIFVTVFALLLAGFSARTTMRVRRYNRKASAAWAENVRAGQGRDALLDYLLDYYGLTADDPYVLRPGFDEKRCHHCHYPIDHGHEHACIWLLVRAYRESLTTRP